MDPVSQGAFGAIFSQTISNKKKLLVGSIIGCMAGMAPDLDVFIRSDTDPLLKLEYHRQFTHALIFIPIGAFLVALFSRLLFKKYLSWIETYIICLIGYATHGLLDACTSYGTQLLWPFSDRRIAWNTISVVDPLFTLPLLGLVIAAGVKKSQPIGRLGMAWVAIYLSIGAIQEDRAMVAGEALAAQRGHAPAVVSAKPSFGNLLLWKTVYEYDDRFWVDAVRAGGSVTIIEGDHVRRLDLKVSFPWLDPESQQARDVERFRWFSNDYLAVDRNDPFLIVDMRYSHLPNEIEGLWGIRLDPDAASDEHVTWIARRSADSERIKQLWTMLKGN